jgi:hypothetical protein
MKAPVLEKRLRLWLREIAHPLNMGSRDACILIGRVGIWGSDMFDHKHGRIVSVVFLPPCLGPSEESSSIGGDDVATGELGWRQGWRLAEALLGSGDTGL